MILRRITKHVKDQNWFAVALDFFIVVAGILIAFQITNWSEVQSARRDYDLAIERYRAEIDANLETLDTVDAEIKEVSLQVSKALDALLSCEDTPENRTLVDPGLRRIMGSYGLILRDSALRELTETQDLLAQQSQAERRMFADIRYRMDVFLREAAFLETMPLEERVQNNPLIAIGSVTENSVQYTGVDFSRSVRQPKLNVPLDVACKDNMLVKSFYTWERWQGAMPAVSRILRTELETARDALDE